MRTVDEFHWAPSFGIVRPDDDRTFTIVEADFTTSVIQDVDAVFAEFTFGLEIGHGC